MRVVRAWLLLAVLGPGAGRAAGQDSLPGEPGVRPELLEVLARRDPLRAGHAREAQAVACEAALARLAEWLAAGARAEPPADLFEAGFRQRPATSSRSETRVGPLVRRSFATDAEDGPLDAFVRLWRARLADAEELRASVRVLDLETEPDEPRCEARLELAWRVGGRRQQLELDLHARWRTRAAAAPLLLALEERAHLELESAGPGFVEATAEVLGGLPAFEDQLRPGVAAWRARLDTRLDVPWLGNAAALALGDVDGDGLEDLYVCQPGGLPNLLFVRRSDGRVEERAAEAGVDFLDASRAALLVDLDGDADRDLVVAAGRRLLLLANDGRARFWLVLALEAPAASALAAADLEPDGDLDLFVGAFPSPVDHADPPVPFRAARNGGRAWLLENLGGWAFQEVGAARGLAQERAFRQAAAFEDLDLDGDPDLVVARRFGPPELWRNEGAGFQAASAPLASFDGGTGVSFGDVDGDGRFDLLLSRAGSATGRRVLASHEARAPDWPDPAGESVLWLGADGGRRALLTAPARRSAEGPSWGALVLDLDADGREDLLLPGGGLGAEEGELASFFWREVATAGARSSSPAAAWAALERLLRSAPARPSLSRDRALLNLGAEGFLEAAGVLGLDLDGDARALASCDWDGDGDLDLWTLRCAAPGLRFLRNEATPGTSVTLDLVGTRANRDAIGARLELECVVGDVRRVLLRGVRAGEGCASQASTTQVLALPRGARLARVTVVWPGGVREEFSGVRAGGRYRLVEGRGEAESTPRPSGARAGSAAAARAVPAAAPPARVVLARPVPLARLELVSPDAARPLGLFGLGANGEPQGTGRAIVLSLFAPTPACAGELAELARHADELARADLAVLALSVSPAAESSAAFLAQQAWPLPWASATPAALETLDALQAALLDHERRLALPASFLVDAEGALRVLYPGPVTAEQLLADRALLERAPGELLEVAAPFPGRWMFSELARDVDFLEPRLLARGLVEPAREYARERLAVVRTPPVELLRDFGRRAVAEGKLAEAEVCFRRAHALDPRHFGVLFDWAVVAHRQEKFAEASELYAKCLALRPEDVDARFNLALALIDLGQREGAERERRLLAPRAPELARTLGELLAPVDDGK